MEATRDSRSDAFTFLLEGCPPSDIGLEDRDHVHQLIFAEVLGALDDPAECSQQSSCLLESRPFASVSHESIVLPVSNAKIPSAAFPQAGDQNVCIQ
ncbi:MAG TPA: hypothetical protein VJ276_08055 [Thermoanaerobaculia bacterium]|nr:hypothetical protein [Thermoanaerobaculia bacterium]